MLHVFPKRKHGNTTRTCVFTNNTCTLWRGQLVGEVKNRVERQEREKKAGKIYFVSLKIFQSR